MRVSICGTSSILFPETERIKFVLIVQNIIAIIITAIYHYYYYYYYI